jgi:hypothetical protein
MAVTWFIRLLVLSCLVLGITARHAPPHKLHQHRHEAVKVGKRQGPPSMSIPAEVQASKIAVLTYITPSPSASPVGVTSQSQIVTSFVPQFTLCELPFVEFFSISTPRISANPTTAPYKNVSVSLPSGTGECTTIYSPTITMVCATVITALVDKYTVSECPQEITFSAELDYVLVTPTSTPLPALPSPNSGVPGLESSIMSSYSIPQASGLPISGSLARSIVMSAPLSLATSSNLHRRQVSSGPTTITPGPSIETLTTYYLAPWTELTAGTPPTDVDLKVCRTFAANDTTECVREYQVWSTSLVTLTSTSVTSINISTTIHGMSQILVETFVANVTEQLTTFSMSTTMDLEFQTEWTTTHSSNRTLSPSTGPTVYETLTVEYASATP